MVKKKVGSITLAVGLITLGALLFAQNFIDISLKDIYKYWPVLLIGLGLEMVLYMLLYGRNNNEVKLSVDGLCIAFIIILGLISNGAKLMDADTPGRMLFGYNGSSIVDGIKYSKEIKETYSRDNISSSFNLKELRVTNNYGGIKVLPGDEKGIRLEADITVKCNDESKAREYAKDAIEIKEGELTEISPKEPVKWEKSEYSKAQIDFVIYVPKQLNVDAEGSFGDIEIESIDGKCILGNKNGEIKAADIGGDVDIDNSFGDIEVNNIGGKVGITNMNGDIAANKIFGSADLVGRFGEIEAAEIGGDLKVVNSNGQITVCNVSGKADITNAFGDIEVRNVESGVTVESKNGKIEALDVMGSSQIKNSFGDIYFKSASINDGDIYAKTKFGSITCEKPLQLNKEGQDTVAKGKLGSGQYKIELTTNNGDIKID